MQIRFSLSDFPQWQQCTLELALEPQPELQVRILHAMLMQISDPRGLSFRIGFINNYLMAAYHRVYPN